MLTFSLATRPALAADIISIWNVASGNWSVAANWSNDSPAIQFPHNGNGGFTYDAWISSGFVVLDQHIDIEELKFDGGTITGSSNLTLHDVNSSWSFGTMSGSGQTIIAPGASMNFEGHQGSGANRVLSRAVVNNGSITFEPRSWSLMTGATFQNNGSVLVDPGGNYIIFDGAAGANTFNNAGTFTKIGASVVAFWISDVGTSMVLNNTGTVDVQESALSLEGGVTQHVGTQLTGGTWRVGPGASLEFDTGSNITTNLGDVTLDGAGSTFDKINTLAENQGRFSIVNGRDFTAAGAFNNTGELHIGAGSTFTAPSLAQLGGGALTAGSWHVAGELITSGANISTNFANLTLDGPAATFSQSDSISDNRGTFTILNGRDYGYSAGAFTNTGTVVIGAGTTMHLAQLSQHVGAELTAGAWHIGPSGTLLLDGTTGISKNSGSVTLDGTGSSFTEIESLVDNRGNFAILNGRDFSAAGTFHNHGTVTIGEGSTFTASSGFIQHATGKINGSGKLIGTFTNSGRLAPGNSPGFFDVQGNYFQTSTGVLEIEVGGTTPGTLHDQVRVTGEAEVDGRLEVSLVEVAGYPTYSPQIEDHIVLLTAQGGVQGEFNAVLFTDLPASVAHRIHYNANDVTLEFVAPEPIEFVSQDPVATWSSTETWEENGNNATPESNNTISVRNLIGTEQRVDVTTSNQSAHQLLVGDTTTDIAVRVEGVSLSIAAGTVINQHGAIELANSGTLVTQTVEIEGGGLLAGNGTVRTNELLLANGILRPGFSVGHLNVEGNYKQGSGGTMLIEIEGAAAHEFDSVDVSGSVQLGGTLTVDVSTFAVNDTQISAFEIITAGSLAGEFEAVEFSGADNSHYFFPDYDYENGAVRIVQGTRGDMNGDGLIDSLDIDLFVFALLSGSEFRFLQKAIELCDAHERFCELPSSQAGGDWSGSGIVDFDDIADFQQVALGNGLAAGAFEAAVARYFESPAVPEPASGLLLIWLATTLSALRQRRVNEKSAAIETKWTALKMRLDVNTMRCN